MTLHFPLLITSGIYYMPLNPDVILEPDYIAEMVEAFEQDRSIGWVSGKLRFLTKDGKQTKRIYTTGHIVYRDGSVENVGGGEEDEEHFLDEVSAVVDEGG